MTRRSTQIEMIHLIWRPHYDAFAASDLAEDVVHDIVVGPHLAIGRADAESTREITCMIFDNSKEITMKRREEKKGERIE